MNNGQQQIEYLKKRLTDLQRYINREFDMILDEIKLLEKKEEVHGSKIVTNKSLVVQDTWKDIPEVLTPKDVQRILKVGLNQAYNLVKSNQFHHITIGRKILIPKQSFINWLEGREGKE
ncbi:helix-turn-helix domain-containing protein [Paenibacillus sp. EC2-1]|uniref:helix-turn-helix domain-containing protein n=1 Tax=Paenibacillus sp. EC2-1 TaxID=3388665 RepID=UPI003BEF38EA